MQSLAVGCRAFSAKLRWMLAAIPLLGTLPAQVSMTDSGNGGPVNLIGTDLAVLEAAEIRKDLPCNVSQSKPVLGFDLRFHGGYEVSLPLNEVAGEENMLTILFRVSPQAHREQSTYFVQHIRVPNIDEKARGDAYLQGGFDLGEGSYHVDWLMRDRSERVCADSWEVDASLPPKDRSLALAIAPNTIERSEFEQFKDEPPIERSSVSAPLSVKVLVNFAPQSVTASRLQPLDTSALVSILRGLHREPRIGKFSIVAFNLQEERVVYRQEEADQIDFPSLGKAVTSISPGTIDLHRLSEKHGETNFLTDLIRKEVGASSDRHPDAVIFAGPKALLDASVPTDALRQVGELDYPVFYMNYNLYPQIIPWKDAIGHTVKYFRGTEYTISRPRDLWFAVTDLVTRVVKSRNGKTTASISTQ